MHTATELLRRQLRALSESWEEEHGRPLAAWELEGWLETGLSIFRLIRRLDEQLGAAEAGGLYDHWLRNAAGPLGRLGQLEAQGHAFADASEFRDAEREAREALHVPLDAVLPDARPAAAVPDVTDVGVHPFPA